MLKNEAKTFALIHGSWHDAWCWTHVRRHLKAAGHDAVAMDLPISEPLNFDDYAGIIAGALDGRKNVVGVFHSRAGNYGPRAVNLLNAAGKRVVEQMILVGAAFENSTSAALGHPKEGEDVPVRNVPASRSGLVYRPELGPHMTTYTHEAARKFLYHDVTDESLVIEALQHLQPQYRPPQEEQPVMEYWPDVRVQSIISREDQMINTEWLRTAAEWLGVKPVIIPGGHVPLLSRPEHLASTVLEFSDSNG